MIDTREDEGHQCPEDLDKKNIGETTQPQLNADNS